MAEPVDLSFTVADYLRTTNLLPAPGAEDVNVDAAIVASFNQPVWRWEATLPRSLRRSRSSRLWKGAGNGSTPAPTSFILSRRWQGNRISRQPEYGIENGFGCRMGRSRTAGMDVHHVPSNVVSLSPPSWTCWPLDPAIKLTFNQPMDTESVESNFSFRGTEGPLAWEIFLERRGNDIDFRPDDLLERNVGYTVNVNAAAGPKEGWSSVRIMVPCTPPMTTLL